MRNAINFLLVTVHCWSAPLGCQPTTHAQEIVHAQATVDPQATVREGDWIVNAPTTITGEHIRLRGNLILDPGAELTLVDCTIELIGRRSREHIVDWRGGNLITRNTTIGGGLVDGRAIHTVFHVYNGRWDATDTVVQYSYGISFGKDPEVPSILRATRLTAGPRHDAILLANHGDVELVDCNFPIAVGVFADQGGQVSLDLPVGEAVSTVFDDTVILDCTYKAKLVRHTVDGQWFVFVRSIKPADEAPPYTVVLNDCPQVLPSVLSWNVKADLRISKNLKEPIVVGNTTIKRGEKPPGITMWSFYGGGDKYDLTLRGSDVHLGRPTNWSPSPAMAEVNLEGHATLVGENCTANNVEFHAGEQSSVKLQLSKTDGLVKGIEEGGQVQLISTKSIQPTNVLMIAVDDLSPAGLRATSVKRVNGKLVYNEQPFALRLKSGLEQQPVDGDLALWASTLQHYLASVALADRCIGRLLDGLDNSPHRDNAMVILWSDHGYHLGEKMHESKYKLWDDANNVMFMIHDPRTPSSHGQVYGKPVSLIDVYPTVAAMADLELPDERQIGVDLTPILRDPSRTSSEYVVGSWSANNPARLDMFIMNDTYRLIRFGDDRNQIELYKIDEDPSEEHNLAS